MSSIRIEKRTIIAYITCTLYIIYSIRLPLDIYKIYCVIISYYILYHSISYMSPCACCPCAEQLSCGGWVAKCPAAQPSAVAEQSGSQAPATPGELQRRSVSLSTAKCSSSTHRVESIYIWHY